MVQDRVSLHHGWTTELIVVPKNDHENFQLCTWAANILKQDVIRNARSIAVVKNEKIAGVVILHDWSPPNVFLSWASVTPRWMSRDLLLHVFNWAYVQLRCKRITGLVERNNKRARDIDERLGMKLEGVLRKAAPSGRDLMVYGLLKEEAEQLIKRMYGEAKTTKGT